MKKSNKQINLKLRYNIVSVSVYIVGIILLIQLFNLQIVHGAEYRETSNTRLTRESTLRAARGNIKDSSGTTIVETTTSYNLEIYKSKIDTKTLNETLLRVANVLEQHNSKYIDNLPLQINPFRFTYEDEEKEKKWKKSNKIDENLSAEETFYKLKEKYEIETDSVEDARKIMAIRYHIAQEGYSSTKSVIIAQNVSLESVHIINEQNDLFPGIYNIIEPVRAYPKGSLASHIVGYVSKISSTEYKKEKDNGYNQNDFYGHAGIERIAEKYLKGTDGIKQIDMAVDGTITSEYTAQEAVQGADVILTIDANLQAVTEKALRNNIEKIKNGGFSKKHNATGGAIVVMKVQTGEVLAMASYPDYEPSKFTFGLDNETNKLYSDKNIKPVVNRAIQETYSPGSIFKMVTAIAGLESGAITTSTKINDVGVFTKSNINSACWIWRQSRRTHGYLNVSDAIKHSCNYFFYEVGYRIGIDTLAKYAKYFGLGQKTGIELTSEVKGTVTERKEGQTWMPGYTTNAAIGQQDSRFTPIQMAKYASMLANGGKVVNPTIIKEIRRADGTVVPMEEYQEYLNEEFGITKAQTENLQINENNLKAILEGMRSVTSESGGTAYSTFRNFNIEVGGKTGSVQTQLLDENGEKITHAWFLGFAPFDNPEIAVVVLIENGGSGGYTAEAARDVMAEYFGMNANQIDENVNAIPTVEIQN